MKIIWRDLELNEHEIDLTEAIDVKINGIGVGVKSLEKGIIISVENNISVMPQSTNVVIIINHKAK